MTTSDALEAIVKLLQGLVHAGEGQTERWLVTEVAKRGQSLWRRRVAARRSSQHWSASEYALLDPKSLSTVYELGLYMKSSMSFGSKAPLYMADTAFHRYAFRRLQTFFQGLESASNQIQFDSTPDILTFATGLLTLIRITINIDAQLRLECLQVATVLLDWSHPLVESERGFIHYSNEFSIPDLRRLYRECVFSHGIACQVLKSYLTQSLPSNCELMSRDDYLRPSGDGSQLLHIWQLTSRSRLALAGLHFSDACEPQNVAAVRTLEVRELIVAHKTELADERTQTVLRLWDPARTVENELHAAASVVEMISVIEETVKGLANGALSKNDLARAQRHTNLMNKSFASASHVQWHAFGHCTIAEGVYELLKAPKAHSRSAHERKGLQHLRKAQHIFAMTNDRTMAGRTRNFLDQLYGEQHLRPSLQQVKALYFGN